MRRDHWKRYNDSLDPQRDYVEIYGKVIGHEFPWDMNQALGFALFRTYAVPGIGRLLDQTDEFTRQPQKRYDDTALLLEPPYRLGFDEPEAKAAIRRINQMHRSYDIPNHEFRYVLSTFVVVPKRWLDEYGKRPLTSHEVEASVQYYRALGRHMNIKDIPETYAEFEELMDSYEAEHFAYDEGGRRVADATLALLVSFQPRIARQRRRQHAVGQPRTAHRLAARQHRLFPLHRGQPQAGQRAVHHQRRRQPVGAAMQPHRRRAASLGGGQRAGRGGEGTVAPVRRWPGQAAGPAVVAGGRHVEGRLRGGRRSPCGSGQQKRADRQEAGSPEHAVPEIARVAARGTGVGTGHEESSSVAADHPPKGETDPGRQQPAKARRGCAGAKGPRPLHPCRAGTGRIGWLFILA